MAAPAPATTPIAQNIGPTIAAAAVATPKTDEKPPHDFVASPFEPVPLADLALNTVRKASASYQLITAFMASGLYAAKPPTGSTPMTGKTAMTLTQFARQHDFPVRAMNRDGQLILRRLDHQPGEGGKLGAAIPNWKDTEDAKPKVRAPRGTHTVDGKPVVKPATSAS